MSSEKTEKKKVKGFKEFDPKKFVDTKPVLKEAPVIDTAVVTFARMNPITVGHELVVNRVIAEALKRKAFPGVYLSHTSDKKKNPLTYDQKISFAKTAFGKVVRPSAARTIIEVLKELQSRFRSVVIVVGSDRVKEFDTLLNKYNGKEYKFESIEVVSAGERDPDAEDISGMSASKMRQLAQENKLTQFKKGLPKKLQSSADIIFSAVRSGMGLEECYLSQEEMNEAVLNRSQRLRKAMVLRRMKSRIRMGRQRAARKRATTPTLQKRARRGAIQAIKRRLAKGIPYGDMSYSQRAAIDKRVAKIPKSRISVLARRLLPKVRRKETERLARRFGAKKSSTQKSSIFKPKKVEPKSIERKPTSVSKSTYKPVEKKPEAPKPVVRVVTKPVKVEPERKPEAPKLVTPKKKKSLTVSDIIAKFMPVAKSDIKKFGTTVGTPKPQQFVKVLNKDFDNMQKENLNSQFENFITERNLGPQDPDVKGMPGTQPKPYYKGVAKDKKDDRVRHFKRNAKKDDRDPEAYKPAPGDAEATTKTSKHTKKFAQKFGESIADESMGSPAKKRRYHMLMNKNGSVIFDKRFKIYRKARELELLKSQAMEESKESIIEEILELQRAINEVEKDLIDNIVEETLNESNPLASVRKKSQQTGISYGILKKVFDRGVAAWKGGHRPGTTPAQWGLARINSFATGGKTRTTADADLWAKHKGKKESAEIEEGPESWESGYKRRVVRTTKPEHKEKGYNWRIKGKERPEISIKLYKDKPSYQEFVKQMKRVAGHEFGG